MKERRPRHHPAQHRRERRRIGLPKARGVVVSADRLPDGQHQQEGQEQPRQAGDDEGGAPVCVLGDVAAPGRADQGAERNRQHEDSRRRGALGGCEIVGHHRGRCRRARRLADADGHPRDQQLDESRGDAAEAGGDRPEEDADPDDGQPSPALGDPGDGDGQQRVQQREGQPAEEAELRVGQMQGRLDRLAQRADHLPVDEAEHRDQQEDQQHPGAIAGAAHQSQGLRRARAGRHVTGHTASPAFFGRA